MKTPDLKDRVEFWKFAYARISFDETYHFSKMLVESGAKGNSIIRRALSYAIWASYGRPFKQRPAVKLPDSLVPNEHRETHDLIITIRDKIIAHRDLNGPLSEDVGLVNFIQLEIRSKEISSVSTASPILSNEDASKILKLSEAMREKMDYHLDKYRGKLKDFVSHLDGDYLLNLNENPEDWLKRSNQVTLRDDPRRLS